MSDHFGILCIKGLRSDLSLSSIWISFDFYSSSTSSCDNNYLFLFFNNKLYCWILLFTYFVYFVRAVDTGVAEGGALALPPFWSKRNFSPLKIGIEKRQEVSKKSGKNDTGRRVCSPKCDVSYASSSMYLFCNSVFPSWFLMKLWWY